MIKATDAGDYVRGVNSSTRHCDSYFSPRGGFPSFCHPREGLEPVRKWIGILNWIAASAK